MTNGRLIIDYNVDLIKSIKWQRIDEFNEYYYAVPEEKRAELEWLDMLRLGAESATDIFITLCNHYFNIFKRGLVADLNVEILKHTLKFGVGNFNKFLSFISNSQIDELRWNEILIEAAKNGRQIFDDICNLIPQNQRQNIKWLDIFRAAIESSKEMFIYVRSKVPDTMIMPEDWVGFLEKAAGNSLDTFCYIYSELPQDQVLDISNWSLLLSVATMNEKIDVFNFILTKIPDNLKSELNWNEILEYAAMSKDKTFEVVYKIYDNLRHHDPKILLPNFSNIFIHSNRRGIQIFNALYPYLEENIRTGLSWHNILCSAAVNKVSDFEKVYSEYEKISEFFGVEAVDYSNVLKTAIEYGQLETFMFIYSKIPEEFADNIRWGEIANQISELCGSNLVDDYQLYKLLKFFYSTLKEINEKKSLIEVPVIHVPQIKVGKRLFDSINSFVSFGQTNERIHQILIDDESLEAEEENNELSSMPSDIIKLISSKLFQVGHLELA